MGIDFSMTVKQYSYYPAQEFEDGFREKHFRNIRDVANIELSNFRVYRPVLRGPKQGDQDYAGRHAVSLEKAIDMLTTCGAEQVLQHGQVSHTVKSAIAYLSNLAEDDTSSSGARERTLVRFSWG